MQPKVLILAGGESQRMGYHKGLLQYHGISQVSYLQGMTRGLGLEAFISCKPQQAHLYSGFPLVTDLPKYQQHGPISGLLSAFELFEGPWILLGCDYPFFSQKHLKTLLDEANHKIDVVAWKHPENDFLEPLLALYMPSMGNILREKFIQGEDSLQRIVAQVKLKPLIAEDADCLSSIDSPEAVEKSGYSYENCTMNPRQKEVNIDRYEFDNISHVVDAVAVEEPLEIRLEYGPENQRSTKNLSITMRTPGNDGELALGFLLTEGIITNASDVLEVKHLQTLPGQESNTILACLNPQVQFNMQQLERHFYTSSSCGVCGKSSLDAVKTKSTFQVSTKSLPINKSVVTRLPETLRNAQVTFQSTGGLHASGLFDLQGNLLAMREDVGRHNALDKLLGWALASNLLPLEQHILLLSGRASFELIQKAGMAGARVVCAVGAPSSLAVDAATEFGITLIGFLKETRFNVYSGNLH